MSPFTGIPLPLPETGEGAVHPAGADLPLGFPAGGMEGVHCVLYLGLRASNRA